MFHCHLIEQEIAQGVL